MKNILIGLFLFSINFVQAQTENISRQNVLDKFGFSEHTIPTENDTIYFYTHLKDGVNPKHLVLHLQGTLVYPLFSIEEEKGRIASYRSFPGDYKLLDEDYCYVVITKTGIPGVLEIGMEKNINKFQEFNTLDNRVFQADTVINYISESLFPELENIIVYGHSEGAPVAAKLGTINSKITHLGFWAGNALPDFFDFMLFNTKAVDKSKLSRKQAFENIAEQIEGFEELAKNRDDISYEDENDYTNKRWWSYAEPPINHLLEIDIPIFMQVAGNDKSAPIESTFLVPLEFTRLGKENLTYRICAECDHSFYIEGKKGKGEDKWSSIFNDFIVWTKNTPANKR